MRAGRSLFLVGICLLTTSAAFAQSNAAPSKEPSRLRAADAAFREGFAAQQAGKLKLAGEKFTEVVKLAPKIAEGHEALGVVLLMQGKTTEAIAELQIAAQLEPANEGNEANLASAYRQAGQEAKAIPHFEAAVRAAQQPGHKALDAGFYDAYGRALASMGRLNDATKQLLTEESLTGPRADVEDAIGSLYARQQEWDKARERFEHALTLDSTYTRARVHLGVVYRQQHDLAHALSALEPAAAANPPDASALAEYGRALAATGKDDEAIGQLQHALKIDPKLPGAALDLAMALQRLGRQQEAIPLFQQALADDPKNASILTNLGLALTLTGKANEALASFKQALTVDPKSAVIYKDLGVAHIQLSAFDESIDDFKKALTLEPNDPQLHYDLGLAYKFKDQFDDAIAELRTAGKMDPTLQDPPYTLGILLMQMGKLDDAVVELKKAVALRPESGDAWAILGSTLKQDSRLPEAADALRKAIPLLPGQPGPRVTLAGVLAEEVAELSTQADAADAAGDTQKAEQLRARMKDLRGQVTELRREGAELARSAVNRQRANFAMNAGNQLMLRGQIADAIARYQESIAADPTFATPHNQLAIAYEQQGRGEDAAAERAKAAELEKTK